MSYQAIIRDSKGNLIRNQQVGMRISIIQGTIDGKIVYSELQTPTTNTNGLAPLVIGTGVTNNDLSSIDWANGPYFIKTETDPNYSASVAANITAADTTRWHNKVESSSLATVATTGKYSDLTGTPTLAAVATSNDYNDLSNKPALATVASSGSYNDLNNKSTTDGSETKINADSNVTVTGSGTSASPYVISSSGGSSGPTIKEVTATTTLTSSDELVFCAGAFSGGPTYTVYLPSSPKDGQHLEISTKNGMLQ
ncbi:hypothetical protein [Prolixibacter sp. SD074]|uniref:hypothetical protein n=1 Tax=Prolixibacter sp. SD074 TaxID=2652391 RepID=UPI0012701AC0|nr:hypothetical protein [Prolixibacter sp. SD074]GET29380.1 hypothetical protein SD074_15820 [Prolixibacter sp. SD074]